ncbi:hypothetical protein CPAL_12230 [Clostridium thermopalmarium DSM 5974]|uniref:Uncharacterized protein n=1 Tax=Clostridium thermopalmarium DSM 5974 TaxID=1121340 RepID=A0A2T0AT01_9CLOT|nr:hypothetical protein CPAL_12230 [Clostridium thermopalmarium DSM 5974]
MSLRDDDKKIKYMIFINAGVAKSADAQDLKSCGANPPYRFKSGLQHQYRGVEQLVARRAHNPKVVGSNPIPATNKHGGIAQLARAFGSYPKCRRFKSYFRYQTKRTIDFSMVLLFIVNFSLLSSTSVQNKKLHSVCEKLDYIIRVATCFTGGD